MAGRSAPLLLFLLMAEIAAAGDGIDGRFGRTEVRYIAAKPAIFHNGLQASAIDDAQEAAILRLMPEATKDFVLVQTWKPTQACPASFRLLAIRAKEPIQTSPAFGACGDLAAITFAGQYPVIHLRRSSENKIGQLAWKDGKIFDLPPVTSHASQRTSKRLKRAAGNSPTTSWRARGACNSIPRRMNTAKSPAPSSSRETGSKPRACTAAIRWSSTSTQS